MAKTKDPIKTIVNELVIISLGEYFLSTENLNNASANPKVNSGINKSEIVVTTLSVIPY